MGDRDRLSRIEAEQDRAVGEYFRYQLYPYSAFYRKLLDTAGIGATGVRTRADVSRVPTITLSDIDDPAALVLRPDPPRVVAGGSPTFSLAMRWATLTGQEAKAARRRIDPIYKPIHWTIAGNGTQPALIVGSSAADLDRLSELGRRWLEQAGIRALDVLVSILPAGPNLAFWQLQLGARRGGVSTLLLEPDAAPDLIAEARPTALAGRPADLVRLLERATESVRQAVRTVITAGDPLDDVARSRLQELTPEAFVVAAWSPPGTRALWSECRGGTGFHTWPHAELVEVVDGEIVWSALGWRGTALVRLRTGLRGRIDSAQCPTCGRTTPRVLIGPPMPAFAATLNAAPELAGWQAELRTVDGKDETTVFVVPAKGFAALEPVLRVVDDEHEVTQFVVVDRAALNRRLAAAGNSRVVDLRDGRDSRETDRGVAGVG